MKDTYKKKERKGWGNCKREIYLKKDSDNKRK